MSAFQLPFDDDNVQILFKKIRCASFVVDVVLRDRCFLSAGIFPIPDYLNPLVVDLLKKMLTVDNTDAPDDSLALTCHFLDCLDGKTQPLMPIQLSAKHMQILFKILSA